MTLGWRFWWWKLGVASLLGMGGAIATSGDCAKAQITLGTGFAVNTAIRARRFSIDPSSALSGSRWQFVDIRNLVEPACSGNNTFIVTGRGGLPPSPSDTLSSDTVWTDLRYRTQQAENRPNSEEATQLTNPATEQLVEAQGWVIDDKGEVVLTTTAPTVTPHIPWLIPASCHAPEPSS